MDNLPVIHGLSTQKRCFLFVSMDNFVQEKKESSHSGALDLFLNHDKRFRACATKLASFRVVCKGENAILSPVL